MSRKTYVDNAMNRSLGRVGMDHGSCVHSSSSSTSSTPRASYSSYDRSRDSSNSGRTYVDNPANRTLGRVGEQVGSHVVHRDGSTSGSTTGCSGYSSSSSKTYVDNSTNRSLGRVGRPVGSHVVHKDGTTTVSSLGYDTNSSCASMSQKTYADNSANHILGRVGKPVGSHVVHKDGSISFSSPRSSAATTSQNTYVDNSKNRILGRVGKTVGSHVVHKDGKVTTSASGSTKCYVDNAYNRKLGRVGQPHVVQSEAANHQRKVEQELLCERKLDEIVDILHGLQFSDSAYVATVNARHELQRSQVEETWKKSGIAPSTDPTKAVEIMKEIIPLGEIDCHKKIGEGGFGKVYAGLWKKAIPIAFKKFIYQQITTKQQEQLVREIKIFSALDHPNIVKMFGVVVEKNNLGIVMEYLPKTLYHAIFIAETKFSNCQKKKIVSEVVAALEYLHTPNDGLHNPKPKIAHCDVKSQNILLDRKNTAKLCDFGLSAMKNSAQSSSSRTSAVPGQGTPRYAAPEVMRGDILSLTGLMKSDIYSLSLVIYEVLVEEVPFEELGLMQLLANVGRSNYRPSLEETSLTASIKQLLIKSWDENALHRPNIYEFSKKMSEISDLFCEGKQPID